MKDSTYTIYNYKTFDYRRSEKASMKRQVQPITKFNMSPGIESKDDFGLMDQS